MGSPIGSGNLPLWREILFFLKALLEMPFNFVAYIRGWSKLPYSLGYGQFKDVTLTGFVFTNK